MPNGKGEGKGITIATKLALDEILARVIFGKIVPKHVLAD